MKIDPRVKMLMALCLSGLALLYSTPGQLLLIFAITITLLFVFHFDIMTIGKYLRPFITLLLIIFLVQCFFTPGGYVLLSAGRMTLISSYGLQTGMAAVLRILVVTAAAMLLTTFNSRDMVLGLVQWKVPYEIAFMVSVALRFLPLFRDEMQNVVTAVQLRELN
jgi:energy-coupling factor transport system permease protein